MKQTVQKKSEVTITNAQKAFSEFLKQRGLTYTKARAAAVGAIYSFDSHFDLEELKNRFADQGVQFHFTSLFRLLNLLIEAGLIEKIKTDAHRRVAYECTLGRQHHDHMVCTNCGEISEFHNSELEKLQNKIAKEHEFEMHHHSLVMSGLCHSCKTMKKQHRGLSPSNVVKHVH